MSKFLKVLVGILIVVVVVLGVLYGAQELSTTRGRFKAHVLMNGEIIDLYVVEYQRISSGWLRLTTESGVEYQLNEKNVIIEK